ncbi:MAG TPA: M20/M25/M40 family metallo-hydrolase, partial [Longimicrobiales bacterium]|nr:M20/M25/M40 family metallo-hydrolase [Longimicrobiales bacterium]
IAFLASDELLGRDTPSPGLEAAAEYAADQFREFGLEPAGDDGSFIQRFPFDASSLDLGAALVQVRTADDATRLAFGDDYFVMPARIDSVVGSPIFLGPARPGLLAPAAAAGRPVMFFAPDTASAAWQAAAGAAVQAAMAARASAAILILPPEFSPSTLATVADQLTGQIMPVPMPVVGLQYAAAQQLFRSAGVDLDDIRTSTDPMPLPEITLALRTPVSGTVVQVPNIVAVLPGSGSALSDEYIVFSAHIDHVGVGRPDETGDSIYNGADDDASGTTAVLEIAEAFASLDRRPARSIMFLLVSGEEKGLLGSMYFVENPPVPLSQVAANINMDMVGRNAPDSLVAIGLDYSSLGPAIRDIAARHPELGLTIAPDLWPEEMLFFRSDHFSFAAKEVPAIFFTSGLHDDYHQPSDEPDTIDDDKVTRVARLLFLYAQELANASQRPEWTAAGLEEVRRVTR